MKARKQEAQSEVNRKLLALCTHYLPLGKEGMQRGRVADCGG